MTKSYKVKKHNYNGFDINIVCEKLEGELSYINDLEINNNTYGIFYNANPNRSKKHKDYLLLGIVRNQVFVSGKDKTDIYPFRIVSALHCFKCNDVIYSPHRHCTVFCGCKTFSIDGGTAYNKISFQTPEDSIYYELVKLDVLTDTILPKELY